MLNTKTKISLIIPAYNEEKSIGKLIIDSEKILKKHYKKFEIIVVDDYSTDNTFKVCKKFEKNKGVRIISNDQNLGKTKSLMKAFNMAKSDVIAFIDGDYQYDPLDLPKVINKVLYEDYDISSGKRGDRKDSWNRKIASKAFNFFNKIWFGIKTEDVNCGLKAIKKNVFTEIKIEYPNAKWFVDTEILAKAYRKNMRIAQTPIRHFLRNEGHSKVNIFNLCIETFFYGVLLKIKFIFNK